MKKYKIIYADPPWHYSSKSAINNSAGLKNRPLSEHYATTKTKDLCKMDVKSICEDEAVLFMWVTDSHLPDALEVIKAWALNIKRLLLIGSKLQTKETIVKMLDRGQ